MSVLASLFGYVIVFLTTLLVAVIAYYKWAFQYWRRKNLHYLEPQIPFGNIADSLRGRHFGWVVKDVYEEMKRRGWKHGGIYVFTQPIYVVLDLEYVKNVMTKDFRYFSHRTMYCNEKSDPLSANLVGLNGPRWKNMRVKLTPTFTSGKMKMMFQTVADCQVGLLKKMGEECRKGGPVLIKDVLTCFTMDIIGSCAFGLDCNAFDDANSPYHEFGRKTSVSSRYRRAKMILSMYFPAVTQFLGVRTTPKDVEDFYMKVVRDTIGYREANGVARNDFLQLLIGLKNDKLSRDEGHDGENLTLEEVAAQCFIFFSAGFDSASTLMTYVLYELANHQEVQDEVRGEIESVLDRYGRLTYESVQDMKYMNRVIDETLRLHPTGTTVTRKCVEDYKVPGEDLVIEKGTTVQIPILGIHMDEEYFPDANKFDPERFNDSNKNSRHSYAYLPFGEGPRACIAKRFGLMESKVGLAVVLKKYKFTVNKKTREPLKMLPYNLVPTPEGGIWLDVQEI